MHGCGFLYVAPKTLTLVLHHPFPALSPLHFAFAARQVRLKGKAKDCKQANFLLLGRLVPIHPDLPLLTEPSILPQKERSAHLAVRDCLGAMVKVFGRRAMQLNVLNCPRVPGAYFSALSFCTSNGDTCRYSTTTSGLLLQLALTLNGEQLPKESYINDIYS